MKFVCIFFVYIEYYGFVPHWSMRMIWFVFVQISCPHSSPYGWLLVKWLSFTSCNVYSSLLSPYKIASNQRTKLNIFRNSSSLSLLLSAITFVDHVNFNWFICNFIDTTKPFPNIWTNMKKIWKPTKKTLFPSVKNASIQWKNQRKL